MINNIKTQFPIFKNQPKLVYLDTAATALKPQRVIDKEVEYYQKYSANVGRSMCDMAAKATLEYEETRELVAKFIGATGSSEVVFTHGTTEGINLIANGWGEENLKPGDEIIVTEVEHHANLLPWIRVAKNKGLVIKYVPLDEKTMELRWDRLRSLITAKTKLISFTHVSNVTGLINDVEKIVKTVKKINEKIVVVVDGAQAVGHMKIEVERLGVDFYVFSGHKMYGPTGVGVVWGRMDRWLQTKPIIVGGGAVEDSDYESYVLRDAPQGFEAGTPAIAQVIGLGEAIRFIEEIGWEEIETHEKEIASYAYEKLSHLKGCWVIGNKKSRIITVVNKNIHAHDLADLMISFNICSRAGHHCALPLHKKLGVLASTRFSFGIYNQKEDIDHLVESIKNSLKIWDSLDNSN
ncbi:MAG: cysteine desulfurase [Candidatus Shapirobacteria bacterium]